MVGKVLVVDIFILRCSGNLDYNEAIAPPYLSNGSGHYSELFIRANWDLDTDLQYDPNVTWFGGAGNFGFNLSTKMRLLTLDQN